MTLLINIIGAGNVSKTIAHLLVKHNQVDVGAIFNRSEKSSLEASEFIGQGKYYPTLNTIPPADITFVTTPDDVIASTCESLSQNPHLKPGHIVVHCSGSLTSDALISAKNKGCFVASIHPMRSFAKPALSIQQYEGTYCAMEGDKEALDILKPLFEAIGSITYSIDKNKKTLYHAAGVFASNYLVTLAEQARLCLQAAGVDDDMSMDVITGIMRGTISNLEKTRSPKASLTGPIQRGDIATVDAHLSALAHVNKKALYALIGQETLALTNHTEEKTNALKTALGIKEKESEY